MSVSINGTNGLVFNDASTQNTAATGFGFKNRIINGAMMIDQRNAGNSVTISGGATNYTLDRYSIYAATNSCSVQRSTTAPAGFTNSLLFTQSGTGSVSAGDLGLIIQRIEGLNCADLGFGTANASTITISFWVRSSLTGTFGLTLLNNAQNRRFTTSYTINSTNTFEYKTITIPGDTTGTWATDNSVGIGLYWDMGVGTTYSTTAGSSWGTGQYYGLTGGTKVCGTTGATFYITGVQLEKGSTATSFDYRPYGTELALCQRYYYVAPMPGSLGLAANQVRPDGYRQVQVFYKTTMRTTPTATFTWNNDGSGVSSGNTYITSDWFSVWSSSAISSSTINPYLTAFNASAEL